MRDWIVAVGFVAVAGGASLSSSLADTAGQRIDTRESFVSLVENTSLRRLGIRLNVHSDGTIQGRALGKEVTGTWKWEGGYFCRDLQYGAQLLEYNCQQVELRGDTLRFTSDRGTGQWADLRLN